MSDKPAWEQRATPDERLEVVRLDCQIEELEADVKACRSQRRKIISRALARTKTEQAA